MGMEQAFIDQLCELPGDEATLNAFKDWLTENNRDVSEYLTPRKGNQNASKWDSGGTKFGDMVGSILARIEQKGDGLQFFTILGEKFGMWYEPD